MRAETPEAPEASLTIALLTWFELNKKHLAIGLGVVIVLTAIIIVYRNHKIDVEESASKSLISLTALSAPGTEPSAEQLRQKVTELAGTKAGERAMFLLGAKLFEDAKYPDAQAAFEQQLSAYPDAVLAGEAALGIASALDAQNKTAEALTAYQRFVAAYASNGLVDQAKMAEARLQESMGRLKEAFSLYGEISNSKSSTTAQEARVRRSEIMIEHPELAPAPQIMTNSVKVVAPPAGMTNGGLRLAPTPPAGAPSVK
jgi:predicted negative regulator of RcsB-dependent stress response